jgi:hypothetical protein
MAKANEAKASEVDVQVLALHTVRRQDELGGIEDKLRGSIFPVPAAELERLERVGAVRRATKDEISKAKKGITVSVEESAVGGRSYADMAARASRAAPVEAAESDADPDAGASTAKVTK